MILALDVIFKYAEDTLSYTGYSFDEGYSDFDLHQAMMCDITVANNEQCITRYIGLK